MSSKMPKKFITFSQKPPVIKVGMVIKACISARDFKHFKYYYFLIIS